MDEEPDYKIRNMGIREEDRQKELKGKLKGFTIKALFPDDEIKIGQLMSMYYFNGLPVSSFAMDEVHAARRAATLRQAIVESPDWWEGPDKCPEAEFMEALYSEILRQTEAFQTELKKNKFAKGGAKT